MELGKRFKSIAIALLMHEVFRTIDGAQFGSSKAHHFSQLKGCGGFEFYLFGKPQNTTERIFSVKGVHPPHVSWRGPKLKKTPIFFVDAK